MPSDKKNDSGLFYCGKILQEIGTQKSIPVLEAVVEKSPFLEPHARAAARSIQSRGR